MVSTETLSQAIQILAEAAQPVRIILFGSYAREDSDVDLLVVEREVA